MEFLTTTSTAQMNHTQRTNILQRWAVIQYDLLPELKGEVGSLTPKLEKLIHILEWVRIEEYVGSARCGVGRPPHDRGALANAFVAKTVLGLATTVALLERLQMDRALRRLCGFPMWKRLPDEATFSRAFAEFAGNRLAEWVHEALIKAHLGETLIGHISRDGTAIEAREKLRRRPLNQPRRPLSAAARRLAKCANRKWAELDGNSRKRYQPCWRSYRKPVIEVASVMRWVTRTAGLATNCTRTLPAVAW